MAKTTNNSKPKKATPKKAVVRKPVAESTQSSPEIENKLAKVNLLPVAIFMVAALVLVGLFVFLRKTLIVATINGQPLTRYEVIRLLEKQNGATVVDSLVSKVLLEQEGRRKNIVISDKEIASQVQKIESQLKAQGSSLESALTMQGLTRAELEEQIELRLILEKLIGNKAQVTNKEVAEYIEANRANYPEEMTEEELNKTVRDQLQTQKLSSEAQKLLENLKNQAKIKYYVTY